MNSPATTVSDRDRVLEAADLLAVIGDVVPLRQAGREHKGLCPFHDDHTPSMSVVTHKGAGFYKCFSCGAGGNALDFMINFHKMEFREALEALAKRFGVPLTGASSRGGSLAPLRRALEQGMGMYVTTLNGRAGEVARRMIEERHISPAMVERFRLGASPNASEMVEMVQRRIASERDAGRPISEQDFVTAGILQERGGQLRGAYPQRLVFPILNESGEPIAFGARRLREDDGPKYLNSPESPLFHKSKALYGIHAARAAIIQSREAIITEGYTDVIACHQAGIENVVATLGTALTAEHAKVLSRLADRVVLFFDGDEAGMRAAERAVPVCFRERIDIFVATMRGGKDPDELLRQPDGIVRMREMIAAARPALELAIGNVRDRVAAAKGTSARQLVIESMVTTLVEWGLLEAEPVRRELLLRDLSAATGVSAEVLVAELKKRVSTQRRVPSPAPLQPSGPSGIGTTAAAEPADRARVRKQRTAEDDLLAAVFAEPERCLMSFTSPDGESATLAELLSPSAFVDAGARSVYEGILERVEAGLQPRPDVLLADLEQPAIRARVIALAEVGADRAQAAEASASHDTKIDLLASALHTLLALIREPEDRASAPGPTTVAEATARLAELRAAGYRPTAHSSTARTTQEHERPLRP